MFVDSAKIYLMAGAGGNGCLSFRREKNIPLGGPDGGDGGHGGDIVFEASFQFSTLLDFKYQQHFKSDRGAHGQGSNKRGRDGKDRIILVPVGTLIRDAETNDVLCDLKESGERFVAARGGEGGHGNCHFKSSTNRAPREFEEGHPGESKTLLIELKLMADVGLIGFPNVGKSTLISHISAAHPKIADYPFTTLEPHLGVVKTSDFDSFVVADIPGLIPGAHKGIGLGDRFLKHVERTGLLLHLLDLTADGEREPWKDFQQINTELREYGHHLADKEQIVALNKTDAYQGARPVQDILRRFQEEGYQVFPISAVTGEGVKELMSAVHRTLKARREEEVTGNR